MSYEIDPANGDLVISGWEKGIGDGPYQIQVPSALGNAGTTGMVDISYANITGVPGEISVEYPLTASTIDTTGGTAMGTPVHKTSQIDAGNGGTVTKYFLLDGKGQIFATTTSIATWTYMGHVAATTEVIGNSGLVYWQGYLFTIRANKIYYSSDSGVTNTDWTGTVDPSNQIATGSTHYALSSQFNPSTMWFCNGAFIAQITVNAGQTFDPTNAATYTAQMQQAAIPSYDMSTCLAEINDQVLVGSSLARVYVWDANNLNGSGVTGVMANTLFLGDRFVYRMVVVNTNAYIFTGHPVIPSGRGNIYITNGSQVDLFKKMPDQIASYVGNFQWQEPYWTFGDAMWHRNKLFFGATCNGVGGVWSIDLNSNALVRANLMSSGSAVLVTVINPLDTGNPISGIGYWCGSGTSGTGVMNYSTSTMATSAVIISDRIPVGLRNTPKTFEQLELKLAKSLATGESIDVTVTQDNQTTFTVGSMSSTDGVGKVFTPLTFQSSQWIVVKCVLNPTNSSPTYVRLREIRLR